MATRTLGSDQVFRVFDVIDAICAARGISLGQAAKEIGYASHSGISNMRRGSQMNGISARKQMAIRRWILEWKHVLKRPAA